MKLNLKPLFVVGVLLSVMGSEAHANKKVPRFDRFTDLGIMHQLKDLVWSGVLTKPKSFLSFNKPKAIRMNQESAAKFCQDLGDGSRLPTREEYEDLRRPLGWPDRYRGLSSYMDQEKIRLLRGNSFWTSSSHPDDDRYAAFNGRDGSVTYDFRKAEKAVLCVIDHPLKRRIETVSNLQVILDLIQDKIKTQECKPKSSLFLFDIDETVLETRRELDGSRSAVGIHDSGRIISTIQELGLSTLALTVGGSGDLLEQVGIELKEGISDFGSGRYDIDRDWYIYGGYERKGYNSDGVLVARHDVKGEALMTFLERMHLLDKYKCIFFVDDKPSNLANVANFFWNEVGKKVYLFHIPHPKADEMDLRIRPIDDFSRCYLRRYPDTERYRREGPFREIFERLSTNS